MKKIIEKEGRTFECYLSSDCEGKFCVVSIHEIIRPRWRFFRTSYRDIRGFWVDEYDSIMQGVEKMIDYFLAYEKKEEERRIKWEMVEW